MVLSLLDDATEWYKTPDEEGLIINNLSRYGLHIQGPGTGNCGNSSRAPGRCEPGRIARFRDGWRRPAGRWPSAGELQDYGKQHRPADHYLQARRYSRQPWSGPR